VIGISSLLDAIVRRAVRVAMGRDGTAAPSSTALVLLNPDPGALALAHRDPSAQLVDLLAEARELGVQIVFAQTISGCGSTLARTLAPLGTDFAVVTKAASAFRSELDCALRRREIDRIVVAGVFTNVDIDATVRHAVELDYHVTVVETACAARTAAEHEGSVTVTLPRIAHRVATRTRDDHGIRTFIRA
jgi:nicotinamidase-related amidase